MDKKLLLSVGLSLVVLLVFQTWFAPKPPVREASAPREMGSTPPAGSESGTFANPTAPPQTTTSELNAIPQAQSPADWSSDGEEQRVEIRSEDMIAEFSSRGGTLVSLQLPHFDGVDRMTPVELVRDPQGEFSTVIETVGGLVDLAGVMFTLTEFTGENGARGVAFESQRADGLIVRKSFVVPASGYLVEHEVSITGASGASGYRVVWDGGVPPADAEKLYKMSASTIVLLGKERENLNPGSFKKESVKELDGTVRWAGVRNKYFAALMVPDEGASQRVYATGNNDLFITGAALSLPVLQGNASNRLGLYLGPLDYDGMKNLGHGLDHAVDLGWKVFRPISALLLNTMTWMYKFIPNYGIVIILISVLTKVLFYPLTKSSLRSMKAMQALQPEVTAVREKYKKDPKRLQEETMLLYKKNKVNPVGGCLPMLVQMPVFFALYSVLSNSITMRAAPFVSWMHDLSVPEVLFSVGSFPIHVLPIVMFATSLLQAKLTPMSGDPRQKMMGYMMPAVLLFVFYSFPAGLNLYWTVNNIMQVAQQWSIHRDAPAATPATTAA